MAANKYLVSFGSVFLAGCAIAQPPEDPLMEFVDNQSLCFAKIEQETFAEKTLTSPTSVREVINESFQSLSPRLKIAFRAAGKKVVPSIRKHAHGKISTVKLLELLRTATYEEFGERLSLGFPNCGSAAFEVLPNFIYRRYKLYEAPLSNVFSAVELYDHYEMAQAIMLMLTIHASGERWEPIWFSKIE